MSAALPQAEVDALTTALFQTRVVTYAHSAYLIHRNVRIEYAPNLQLRRFPLLHTIY